MFKAGCVQCSQIIRLLDNMVAQQRSKQMLYYNRLGIKFNKILCWQDSSLLKPQHTDCCIFTRNFSLSTTTVAEKGTSKIQLSLGNKHKPAYIKKISNVKIKIILDQVL
jgi:hypothetical protein